MSTERKPKGVYFFGFVAVVAAVGGVAAIAKGRDEAVGRERSEREDRLERGPLVRTARAQLSPPTQSIELQGEARPFASVTLYAKVSGYLKAINVDKGDKVKTNQLIAVIESPELDRQYDAALADAEYRRANAKRAAALAGPGVVSAQEAEVQVGQARVAEAQVAALEQQKGYQVLRAPFAGTVTARYADPGALVQSAVSAQTSALPVVTISTPERLRVYVYVSQRDAAWVHEGDQALISVPDTGTQIEGRVARRAGELDPSTRTMLVEVDVDNKEGKIVAGSFVWVKLTYARPPEVQVPAEALVLRGKQAFVPELEGELVRYRPVEVVDDDGTIARLRSGLKAGALVALNLGENVADGARVQPVVEHAKGK